ncbi:MAG: hypothetical protein ACYC0V_11295 [Armatimonadota bacterium]
MLTKMAFIILMVSSTMILTPTDADAQTEQAERGWMTKYGQLQTFALPEGINPIFGQWSAQYGGTLECEFRGKPDTEYQVLIALREMYWHQAGKRIMDIDVSGKTTATVDSFNGSNGNPHAVIYRGKTNSSGILRIVIKANSSAPDQNPAVCGLLLFPGDANLNINDIIHNKGLEPLVTINPANPPNRIATVGDGRLCFGNGYVFGTFVGPFEFAEDPVTQVHDKLSRLYLGYSSSQLAQVGMAPCIIDIRTGQRWTVGACDKYQVDGGVVIMTTKLPIGTVRTETYGVWDKPILVRRIIFTPNKGVKGDFVISTETSLYRDFKIPDDEDKAQNYKLCSDSREWPTALKSPAMETMRLSDDGKTVEWDYQNPLYKKVAVTSLDADAATILNGSGAAVGDSASFTGESAGRLRFERQCGSKGGSLTVVLAFDKELPKVVNLIKRMSPQSISLAAVRKQWNKWYEKGAMAKTTDQKLNDAYRAQVMSWKTALDAELGGHIVGGRYHIQTVWTRDSGVGASVMLDAGHYEDVKKIFRFFANHAYWNVKNNCLHANYHSSGRVAGFICGPGQAPVEEITQPDEWAMQMNGPQLDGMAYYLYNIGKYYRYTGDKAFIKELWPFISKVANALAMDEELTSETGIKSGYVNADGKFRKYNPETGLIVDNCTESGILREHLLMNCLAVLGFREAYQLSQAVGKVNPQWLERANSIDAAIRKHLIKDDGKSILGYVTRPWLNDGQPEEMGGGGYFWTCAATVPYFDYQNRIFKDYFRKHVDPKGDVGGWGMWWATLAQAAFEADLPDTGWNYLSKLVGKLPESHQIYEHTQDVVDSNGTSRNVTLNLFGFNYLTHAVIRGFAGFGYNANVGEWFFRPQIPEGLGLATSTVYIGKTRFDIVSSGNGDTVAEFKIDGQKQAPDGILSRKYIDGKTHKVEIRMKTGSGN